MLRAKQAQALPDASSHTLDGVLPAEGAMVPQWRGRARLVLSPEQKPGGGEYARGLFIPLLRQREYMPTLAPISNWQSATAKFRKRAKAKQGRLKLAIGAKRENT